jgi:hypothetical protein
MKNKYLIIKFAVPVIFILIILGILIARRSLLFKTIPEPDKKVLQNSIAQLILKEGLEDFLRHWGLRYISYARTSLPWKIKILSTNFDDENKCWLVMAEIDVLHKLLNKEPHAIWFSFAELTQPREYKLFQLNLTELQAKSLYVFQVDFFNAHYND